MLTAILIAFTLLTNLSCIYSSSEKDVKKDEVYNIGLFMDSLFKKSNREITERAPKAYVVLPNTGCEGCISSTEQMMKTFVTNKYPVKFILTNIVSVKVLRLKLGDSIISNKNVFIDISNYVYQRFRNMRQIYPAVYYTQPVEATQKLFYIQPGNDDVMKVLIQTVSGS